MLRSEAKRKDRQRGGTTLRSETSSVAPLFVRLDERHENGDSGRLVWDATEKEPESPYQVWTWGSKKNNLDIRSDQCLKKETTSLYGVVWKGPTRLVVRNQSPLRDDSKDQTIEFTLVAGMYFSCPAGTFCSLKGGVGILIPVLTDCNSNNQESRWASVQPHLTLGGPVLFGDKHCIGRLPYIDGGSDSLLLSPVIKGAPCLNSMNLPTNTNQTMHTHPSGRIGIVLAGRAKCLVQAKDAATNENDVVSTSSTLMEPGTLFVIPKDAPHAFITDSEESLDLIVFHPDSDFGPTPANHPMLNRTYVKGVSAAQLTSIQTK